MRAAIGPAVGESTCHAGDAHRSLVLMALVLDAAGLDVTEEVEALINAVADLYAGLVQLADDFGHAEVTRRRAA